MADSRFLRRGCQPQIERGMPVYYSARLSWKLHENEENWVGALKICVCRSTIGYSTISRTWSTFIFLKKIINLIHIKRNSTKTCEDFCEDLTAPAKKMNVNICAFKSDFTVVISYLYFFVLSFTKRQVVLNFNCSCLFLMYLFGMFT